MTLHNDKEPGVYLATSRFTNRVGVGNALVHTMYREGYMYFAELYERAKEEGRFDEFVEACNDCDFADPHELRKFIEEQGVASPFPVNALIELIKAISEIKSKLAWADLAADCQNALNQGIRDSYEDGVVCSKDDPTERVETNA